MSITPLSQNQLSKVATALVFSFVSTFVAVFLACGGISNTEETASALAASAFVSAINATLYAATKLFNEDK